MKNILITGGTGFIGSHLIIKLADEYPQAELNILVRGRNELESRKRFEEKIKQNFPEFDYELHRSKLNIICGDICNPMLGLKTDKYYELACSLTHIIHSAANVSFVQDIESARKTNFCGVKNITELAEYCYELGHLKQLAYLSTAYVCGNTSSQVLETKINKAVFSCTYEQSKHEAENYILSKMNRLPVTVFRPSIVVGNSVTGKTTSFNVIYQPLRLMRSGLLRVITGNKSTKLDIVPINYVVDAMCHIIFRNNYSSGNIYNLTSGKENSLTLSEIIKTAAKSGFLNSEISIRFIPLFLATMILPFCSRKIKKIRKMVSIFEPFLKYSPEFRSDNTKEALKGSGIVVPHLSIYLEKLLIYCIESAWGKKQVVDLKRVK